MHKLTEGNITKQLLQLALPLVIGNFLQQLYNTIDAWVVGRYISQDAFAAIGIGGTVVNLFIFVLVGACTGIGIIWAQLYGKGDFAAFRREGFQALVAGSCFTLVLSLAAFAATEEMLRLIATPASILHMVKEYLQIIFAGLIMTFLYNYYSTMLRAVGNTLMALVFLAVALAVNMVLALLFVAYWQWGISGAAWATVLAQLSSVLLCNVYMRLYQPQLLWSRQDMHIDGQLLKHTCNFAVATAMHNSNLYIGKLLVQGAVNSCGVDMVAAYTAAGRLEGFANSFGDSGGAAMNVFIGQNVGAGNWRRVRQGFAKGFKLLLGLGVVYSAALYAGADAGVAFMLGGSDLPGWAQGVHYMRIVAMFYFLCFMGNALAGYFEGRGLLMIPVIGATGHITLRVILSYLFAGEYGLGAVAYATGFGWFCVVCFWSYLAWKDVQRLHKKG